MIYCDNPGYFRKFCEESSLLCMLWGKCPMTINGEYVIESQSVVSIIIQFKKYSNVKLTLNCPKLQRLVINNCNELIMTESTRPRCLELINCSGKINIPEVIDVTRTCYELNNVEIKEWCLIRP